MKPKQDVTTLAATMPPDVAKLVQENKSAEALARVAAHLKAKLNLLAVLEFS